MSHLGALPQGQPERYERVVKMVDVMDEAGFGACTNHGECMAACPKETSVDVIAQLNRDRLRATLLPPRSGKASRARPRDRASDPKWRCRVLNPLSV